MDEFRTELVISVRGSGEVQSQVHVPSDAGKSFWECLGIRERILFKHHQDLAEVNDSLARCYAAIGKVEFPLRFSVATLMNSYRPVARQIRIQIGVFCTQAKTRSVWNTSPPARTSTK